MSKGYDRWMQNISKMANVIKRFIEASGVQGIGYMTSSFIKIFDICNAKVALLHPNSFTKQIL